MRTGKLPPELLARLLKKIPRSDPRVLVAGSVGEDAAALDFAAEHDHLSPGHPEDRILVAKTDPVTFATDSAGWYAVHVNANDVACAGAVPRWFMASALLPETWEESDVERLFDQIVEACASLGVSLIGGHTEVTGGIDRPLIAGTMLGEVERRRLVRTGGGKPGDALVLTQGIAIEGTSVLAREAADALRRQGVPAETIERAQGLLFDPGISVVRAARLVCEAVPAAALHSLHDPTEGGLATGLWELAEASGCGAVVDEAAVPVLAETRAVCDALGIDAWGLLASGSLLAAVAAEQAGVAVGALQALGIGAAVIGELREAGEGLMLRRGDGGRAAWPSFDRDEVARYFDELRAAGG
ncbi:MAG TPA: AIR synthase family protein [Chloroflexota bacterium]|nr:AIR synthase family protein [Chloroflexota bacterium]